LFCTIHLLNLEKVNLVKLLLLVMTVTVGHQDLTRVACHHSLVFSVLFSFNFHISVILSLSSLVGLIASIYEKVCNTLGRLVINLVILWFCFFLWGILFIYGRAPLGIGILSL
jgi:hypothetical protein